MDNNDDFLNRAYSRYDKLVPQPSKPKYAIPINRKPRPRYQPVPTKAKVWMIVVGIVVLGISVLTCANSLRAPARTVTSGGGFQSSLTGHGSQQGKAFFEQGTMPVGYACEGPSEMTVYLYNEDTHSAVDGSTLNIWCPADGKTTMPFVSANVHFVVDADQQDTWSVSWSQ